MGRLAKYKPSSPELAVKLLTNQYLSERLRETKDEREQDNLIDSAAAAAVEELRAERDEVIKKLQEISASLEKIDQEKDELASELQKERAKRARLEQQFSNLLRLVKWIPTLLIWGITLLAWVWLEPWRSLSTTNYILALAISLSIALAALMLPLGKNRVKELLLALAAGFGVLQGVDWLLRYLYPK